ncbi:MAG TPA: VWA domain-containing protein [Candidatus Kapabacteria bacterium]|nr:VWA domain-containing protein [Candidatus Kapabacteria bacterium]
MKIQYSKWTPGSLTAEQRLEQLFRTFSYVLLNVSGNVEEALEWMQYLDEQYDLLGEDMTMEEFIKQLKDRGLIGEDNEGIRSLTPRGVQRIRRDALNEIFSSLRKSSAGFHETPNTGNGIERLSETRQYAFGDQPTNIDLTQTLTNAFTKGGIDKFSLSEDDIEVYETEHQTSCATVLMIDISHSMILYGEDRITPAKQVALALSELITTRFPKDQLRVIVFGDDATEISISDIPFLSVGPFHTNTRAGLQLARQILRRAKNMNKQIFMVTDGKPSAMYDEAHRLYKNSFGLDPRIVNKTLDEAVACQREDITISTFMVADDPLLVNFVEDLTKANRGRAYYANLKNLGETIFVDYIRNRKKKYRS